MFKSVIATIGKVIIPCACRESGEDYETQFSVFPPEVVEKILARTSDNETLFRCRLVNRQWNDIASNLLEQRHLKYWTSWHHNHISNALFLARSIEQNPSDINYEQEDRVKVELPHDLKAFRSLTGNPFPTKSVSVSGSLQFLRSRPEEDYKYNTEWNTFWLEMGRCLTSIIFYDVEITVSQLNLMFTSTPNLKALEIYRMDIRSPCSPDAKSDLQNENINIPSTLQYLHLFHQFDEFGEWLIDKCAHQLVSLIRIHYSKEEDWSYLQKFVNLKHLKINSPALTILDKISDCSSSTQGLECLSINLSSVNKMSRALSCSIMSFISKSSVSLVRLDLHFTEKMLVDCLEAMQIIFPKVKVLTLLRDKRSTFEERHAIQRVLNWFPIIERVMFTPLFIHHIESLHCPKNSDESDEVSYDFDVGDVTFD